MSHWTDAHCHLQERFLSDDQKVIADIHETLARAFDGGVDRVVVIGTDAQTSREALAITALEGPVEIFATVGLHPHEATHGVGAILEMARAGHPKLVGIGECGLDYYYEHSPRAAQRQAFAAQIGLANELDLALVISSASSRAKGCRRARWCTASPATPTRHSRASSSAATSRSQGW
jgi:TatD DNase family protein